MAWEARTITPVAKLADALVIQVEIHYYDTAAPGDVLHRKTFQFRSDRTQAEMREEIQSEGQRARTLSNRAVALAAAVPVGTTIPVP